MSYDLNFSATLSPVHLHMLEDGLVTTLMLAGLTLPMSFAIGLILTILNSSHSKILLAVGGCITELLRNLPGIFLLLFWYLLLPVVVPADWGERMNSYSHWALFSAVLGLSFNNAPYIADIFRAGLGCVSRQAFLSAKLSGLPVRLVWLKVVFPAALLSVLPALNVRLIHGLKNTSLAMLISVQDLSWQAQEIEASTFRGIEITTIVTGIYVLLSFALSFGLHSIEKRAVARLRLKHVVTGVM